MISANDDIGSMFCVTRGCSHPVCLGRLVAAGSKRILTAPCIAGCAAALIPVNSAEQHLAGHLIGRTMSAPALRALVIAPTAPYHSSSKSERPGEPGTVAGCRQWRRTPGLIYLSANATRCAYDRADLKSRGAAFRADLYRLPPMFQGQKTTEKDKTPMSAADILQPHKPEFDRFLYASVGDDRNGNSVTVLSTLARLNLDPWDEAADLTNLDREAARSRLGLLLSRSRDVPALGHDHEAIARDLTLLLPKRTTHTTIFGGSSAEKPMISFGTIWVVLAVVIFLVQMMFAGQPGPGQ